MSNPLKDLEASSEELKEIATKEILRAIKACLKMKYYVLLFYQNQ